MHRMHDTRYTKMDMTKYKYVILLLYPKRSVHTKILLVKTLDCCADIIQLADHPRKRQDRGYILKSTGVWRRGT